MNISPVRFMAPKATTFKGKEPEAPKTDAEIIAEAIDRNTNAVKELTDQVYTISYTIYATEKAKSGTRGLHEKSYSETNSPVSHINYVNKNWSRPTSYL